MVPVRHTGQNLFLAKLRDEAVERLQTIENVHNENSTLETKTKELVAESVDLFLEQWKSVPELYPEIRLGILQKTLELLTPAPEKKK